MALLALFLALAVILAVSYFLIPKDAKGILGTARGLSHQVVDGALGLVGVNRQEPARLLKFDTPEDKVQTGVKTVFTFTASRAIDGVRSWDIRFSTKPTAQPPRPATVCMAEYQWQGQTRRLPAKQLLEALSLDCPLAPASLAVTFYDAPNPHA